MNDPVTWEDLEARRVPGFERGEPWFSLDNGVTWQRGVPPVSVEEVKGFLKASKVEGDTVTLTTGWRKPMMTRAYRHLNARKTPLPKMAYLSMPCAGCRSPLGCPPGPEFTRLCYSCVMQIQWELKKS